MKALVPFASGLLFALGLAVSGMTRPEKVIGFLDFLGNAWDPSLAFVMLGAVGVHALAQRLSRRLARPLVDGTWAPPVPQRIDLRLLLGAVLFGAGWGLSGYCPGPALVSLSGGALPTLVVVGSMLGGVALYERYFAPPPKPEEPELSVRVSTP